MRGCTTLVSAAFVVHRTFAYDGPGTASDGLRTSDGLDIFNGAPDKYEWKLVGKKEMYIPYNNYKLMDAVIEVHRHHYARSLEPRTSAV